MLLLKRPTATRRFSPARADPGGAVSTSTAPGAANAAAGQADAQTARAAKAAKTRWKII
ncbi:hypothetical protein V8F63_01605 [Brevundimonas sp. LF-1]|uniref:hypothetical protein n=1 Tax=Brevundimonas sp. LF-1 TaxID=3126100 RepID=UPI0030E272C4